MEKPAKARGIQKVGNVIKPFVGVRKFAVQIQTLANFIYYELY